MQKAQCTFCNKNKTALRCDTCGEVSCKMCSQFIDENSFEFINLLPEKLINKTYCSDCYNQGISDEVDHYQDLLEKAKTIDVYGIKQSSETRLIKRIEKPIKVSDCDDREEILLRLAFLAAQKGFATMVDVDIRSRKVGEGKAYRKVVWDGSGVPVDPSIKK